MQDFKNIHIGGLLKRRAIEIGITTSRIGSFLNCSEKDIEDMYKSESVETQLLLRWSKLLEYDFFRIYSHHLILYSPPASINNQNDLQETSTLPKFKKNVYTQEIIQFILEQIKTGKKTKQNVIDEYNIPKTTLYKWISKYGRQDDV